MNNIYLDHAATTKVDEKVLEKMKPYFADLFGNASSMHSFGKKSTEAIEKARLQMAEFFVCKKEEIIFTSGATEANNLVIKGVFLANKNNFKNNIKPHIITTSFEHHCVLNAVKSLEEQNLIEATYINPKKDGVLNVKDVEAEIKANTILVSVMYVNNEIGTLQPISRIGKLIEKINKTRTEKKILFHTDATQAVSYFDCDVSKLNVDFLSMSAHKIYGPKGVGALYVKNKNFLKKMQDGGEQENGLRAGTLNTPGIVGLGEAISQIRSKGAKKASERILKLRNYLIEKVLDEIPETKLNGSKVKRSPNNINFNFSGVEGESLLLMLDAHGIFVSTGSACSSGSLSPSHVLLSLGKKPEETHGSIRLTLGKDTTKKEIIYTIKILKKVIRNLRKISGDVLNDYYLINKKK